MPWISAATYLGFSTFEPWLPVSESHRALAVDVQEESADSALQFARDCLKLRNAHAALQHGSMRIIEAGEQRLVFERTSGGEHLRCAFNLSDRPTPFAPARKPLICVGHMGSDMLGPYAAVIEEAE
jgi:alpha-glucosidase